MIPEFRGAIDQTMINIIDFQVIINKENPAILKNIAVPKAQIPLFHVKKACFLYKKRCSTLDPPQV